MVSWSTQTITSSFISEFGDYTQAVEKAMAPHSSTLAWRIPWTEEPGGLPVGLQKLDTTERQHTHTSQFNYLFVFKTIFKTMSLFYSHVTVTTHETLFFSLFFECRADISSSFNPQCYLVDKILTSIWNY